MQIETVHTNGKVKSTGPLMHKMVNMYYKDMLPWAHWSLPDIFDFIKALPFREDPPTEETLMRPLYTMTLQGWGGDCDDKSIALASWAKLNNIPYRFVAVRRVDRTSFHHVYSLLYIGGHWIHADPTYKFNMLGRKREYAQYAII